MKKINTCDLCGNERLARQIINNADVVLIEKGTILKKEYIEKLNELGIESVYIVDMFDDTETNVETTEYQVLRDQTRKAVKGLLEQHIYKHSAELIELCLVAENIIDNILTDDKIAEQLMNINQVSSDLYTHSVNVCTLSTMLALKNNINKSTVYEIARGSILHDIGMRYLTMKFENVDISEMNQEDRVEYRKHVIYGYDAVKDEHWLSDLVKKIILYHHEYINGLGYPFKLKGSKIRKEIKIITICDAFDSMISGIGMKQAKIYEAVEYLKLDMDHQFDNNLKEQFLRMVALYPIGTKVITSEGEIGIVVAQNNDFPDRPQIRIIKDKNGKQPSSEATLNLLEKLNVFIKDTL